MEQTTTIANQATPLRVLLSEAAALRLRGDHGAAAAVEADALRVIRAAYAEARPEVRA